MQDIILKVAEGELSGLEGPAFQVHLLPDNRIRLVSISSVIDGRCPFIVHGERCGRKAGHEGKHMWGSGD